MESEHKSSVTVEVSVFRDLLRRGKDVTPAGVVDAVKIQYVSSVNGSPYDLGLKKCRVCCDKNEYYLSSNIRCPECNQIMRIKSSNGN